MRYRELPALLSLMLCFAMPASLQAEGLEARLPLTDGVTEQWLIALSGDAVELRPAEREDSKDQITLYADSKLPIQGRLEAAILLKSDGSIVSTALDSGDILWQTDTSRMEHMSSLERRIHITNEEILALQAKLQESEAETQHRAGLDEVTSIRAEIAKIDQEIRALEARKQETPSSIQESKR